MSYLLLKFLHVVSAIVWVGGVLTLTAFSFLLLRSNDRPFLVSLTRYSVVVGSRFTGPAAGLTLLTGFATMGVGHLGFTFWVLWGIGTFVVAMLLGAIVFRRAGMEFHQLLGQADPDDAAVRAGQRRMAVMQLMMVALLLTAVGMMVFKPTL